MKKSRKFIPLGTFVSDVYNGLCTLVHGGLFILGWAILIGAISLSISPHLFKTAETKARNYLEARYKATLPPEVAPALAEDKTSRNNTISYAPSPLSLEQARVATWISRKYKVGAGPVTALVNEAYEMGETVHLDPLLLLAVIAIESRFNPFAQSQAGAQGLMQVMTEVHDDKYAYYGGTNAAFDPIANLRVGAWVLKDCVRRGGSIQSGLQCYVGATETRSDGGYANKVLSEYQLLKRVASGSIGFTIPGDFLIESGSNNHTTKK